MLSLAITAAVGLLFVGGALTALGFERLYWTVRSRTTVKRRERIIIDA